MAEMLLVKDHDVIEAAAGRIRSASPRVHYQKQSTAPVSLDRAQTFQVTHVFHPLHGRELAFVDQYLAWGEDRVCFRDDTGKLRYLPTDWTSLASPDPFVQASAGRSHLRVEELLQLTTLIALQRQAQAPKSRRRPRRPL
jgi:hypothetical protein